MNVEAGSPPLDASGVTPSSTAANGVKDKKKFCSSCLESIPNNAIVCRQCRNYQGLYWWWRIVVLSLPWFITLASVIAFLETIYFSSAHSLASDVVLSFESPFNGNLTILASNHSHAQIFLDDPQLSCNVSLRDVVSFIVRSPSKITKLPGNDVLPLLYPFNSDDFEKKLGSSQETKCSFWLTVSDGNGSIAIKELGLTAAELSGDTKRVK